MSERRSARPSRQSSHDLEFSASDCGDVRQFVVIEFAVELKRLPGDQRCDLRDCDEHCCEVAESVPVKDGEVFVADVREFCSCERDCCFEFVRCHGFAFQV